MRCRRRSAGRRLAASLAGWLILAMLAAGTASAADPALPAGFQDSVVFSGLDKPVALRFAPNGMVFVAEQAGKIKFFEDVEDETPDLFKDLRTEAYDHGDRGLLGIELDPEFPTKPYVYALFTYDHVIGSGEPVPEWGEPEHSGDSCPVSPANGADDCLVSGRLVRYKANLETDGEGHLHANALEELVLIPEAWCQQFSSHSVGDLRFGPEGALYASGGEGASFTSADFGQFGEPANPCADPAEEGGSLRSQDLLTPETEGDPTGLSGTVIRIDPETGEGWPTNPLASSPSANERRIVALGFRNPFRIGLDPVTGETYVANVGSSEFEELDRFDPTGGSLYNSGWPCNEGANRYYLFKNLGLPLCEQIYAEPDLTPSPFYYYSHRQHLSGDDECPYASGSAVSSPAFYTGDEFPAKYEGALFFADSVRGCLYAMLPDDEDGRPDPGQVEPFLRGGSLYPGVDIATGPDGALYYASLFSEGFGQGAVHRITYAPGAPQAKLTVDSQYSAEVEHEFHLDASESSDPDEEALTFEWDLDGNGSFETGGEQQTVESTEAKNIVVSVRVEDGEGLSNVAKLTLYPGDAPPSLTIKEPTASLEWGVGDAIHLSGSGKNFEGKSLEPLYMAWSTRVLHCPNPAEPTKCHSHPLQDFPGVLSGDLVAPEHDFPSYIEITLTGTDKRGLTASKTIKLAAHRFDVEIASEPPGVPISAGLVAAAAPFQVPSVEGSQLVVSAPETVELGGYTYTFEGWSDGGAATHTIVASGEPLHTASYAGPPQVGEESDRPSRPSTSLRKRPPKITSKRWAKFTFTARPSASYFRCKLDRRPWRRCRSPRIYRRLRLGRHTFRVFAVNSAGRDKSPAVYRWRVRKAHR